MDIIEDMPDIQITYKGKPIDLQEASDRFYEYCLIEGEVGIEIDRYTMHFLNFLLKETKN